MAGTKRKTQKAAPNAKGSTSIKLNKVLKQRPDVQVH